jgi:hypothetical protein
MDINRICLYTLALLLVLFSSCKREFDGNADYNYNDPIPVFGDNTLLYTKIFQFSGSGSYLWFDIRNEIANFSSPYLGHSFNDNGVDRYKRIDLRGRLYEYNSEAEELKVLDYPLDIVTGQDLPADIVYSFGRKQRDGCDLIADANQRRLCERTFVLSLKRIVFKDINFTLEVNIPGTYNSKTLTMYGMSQELYLTN